MRVKEIHYKISLVVSQTLVFPMFLFGVVDGHYRFKLFKSIGIYDHKMTSI